MKSLRAPPVAAPSRQQELDTALRGQVCQKSELLEEGTSSSC